MSRANVRGGLAALGALGALGAVALVMLLGACSSTPDGFRSVEQGYLKIDVPAEWQPGDLEPGSYYDLALQDEPAQEDATYIFVASSDFPDTGARLALSQLRLFAAFGTPDESGGMSQVADEDAGEMWRWDFTVGNGSHQVVMWALEDRASGHVVVAGVSAKGGLDAELVDTIEDSIEIIPASDG